MSRKAYQGAHCQRCVLWTGSINGGCGLGTMEIGYRQDDRKTYVSQNCRVEEVRFRTGEGNIETFRPPVVHYFKNRRTQDAPPTVNLGYANEPAYMGMPIVPLEPEHRIFPSPPPPTSYNVFADYAGAEVTHDDAVIRNDMAIHPWRVWATTGIGAMREELDNSLMGDDLLREVYEEANDQ